MTSAPILVLRFLLILGAAFLFPFTASCKPVEANESVRIAEDGKGIALLQYAFPAEKNERSGLEQFLKQATISSKTVSGITSFDWKIFPGENETGLVLSIQFEDLYALNDLKKRFEKIATETFPDETENSPRKMLFDIDWEIKGINTIQITRTLHFPPSGTGYDRPDSYGDSTLAFSYSLPEAPSYSNAHYTSSDGKSLVWKFNPSEFTQKGSPSLIFTISPLHILPRNTMAGMAGILTGGILAVIYGWIRRKKRKNSSQPPAPLP